MKNIIAIVGILAFIGCTMPADNPSNSAPSPENTGPSNPNLDTSFYTSPSPATKIVIDSGAIEGSLPNR